MSERYWLWVAQRAEMDELRLSMALAGAFVVILWASAEGWPDVWRRPGRVVMQIMGGMGYVSILAVALVTLARDLNLVR